MKDKHNTTLSGISRRRLLVNGSTFAAAGLAGVSGFPFINRMAVRAQDAPLKFWQFYAPGGEVAPQVAWFEKDGRRLERQPRAEGRARISCAELGIHQRSPNSRPPFASGEGPDIFIISPGDFLRYYNGGVLQDLTPHMDPRRASLISPKA
jgi:multiple sugar transport system substrate-binding protein